MLTYIHTYIRTTEAYLYYKLSYEPKGSGELKIVSKFSMSVAMATNQIQQFGQN